MFPGLAIDYTRSMKVNTAVEWLVQESFQLCSAMQVATAQSLCCFFSPKLVAAEQLNATLLKNGFGVGGVAPRKSVKQFVPSFFYLSFFL